MRNGCGLDTSLRIAKLQRDQALVKDVRDLAIALIQQPATGLLIASVAINGARQARMLTDVQAGLVQAVVLSAAALNAFKPVNLP